MKNPSKSGLSPGGGGDEKNATINFDKPLVNKDGDEICKHVKLTTFKAIYGHGSQVKFVRLLLLMLKR